MTKELEALERLYCSGNLRLDYVTSQQHEEDFKLIESILKSLGPLTYEEHEKYIKITFKERTANDYIIVDKENKNDYRNIRRRF